MTEEAQDFQTSVQNALKKLSDAIANAATLTVETSVLPIPYKGEPADLPKLLVARTELHLDADTKNWIPVREVDGDYTIQSALYTEHKAALETAKEARAELLKSLEGLLGELKSLLDH
jgi:hypothetical protein